MDLQMRDSKADRGDEVDNILNSISNNYFVPEDSSIDDLFTD